VSSPVRICAELTYAKEEPVRFIGHLDLMRAMERALRRAGLPLAYSRGHNPRLRMTFAAALPLGATGAAELMAVDLTDRLAPLDVARSLGQALPEGLRVTSARVHPRQKASPFAALREAAYVADVVCGADQAAMRGAIEALLARARIEIDRQTKRDVYRIDIRPGIFFLGLREPWRPDEARWGLEMLLGLEEGKLVKPEEVVEGLAREAAGDMEMVGLHREHIA
jgi:radical SAM-linked protein